MEKLHELHVGGGFDLVVVDTPPTRHARLPRRPRRLTRLLDNRVFRLLMAPAQLACEGAIAAQAFVRTVSKVVGTEVIDDVLAFFRAFEGMEEGFRCVPTRHWSCWRRSAARSSSSPPRGATQWRSRVLRRPARRRRARGRGARGQPGAPATRARRLDVLRHRATELRRGGGATARATTTLRRLAAQYSNLADLEELAIREE